MDRDGALELIKFRLGNRTGTTDDARIITELDAAQDVLEEHPVLPWFLLTEDMYQDTVAGEDRYRVPIGFLREYEYGALWIYDATAAKPWTELKKDDKDTIRASLGDTIDASGKPQFYALAGDYFRLGPVPDAVYRLYIQVYVADTKPSNFSVGGETNRWLTEAPQMLVTTTLEYMARHMQFPRGTADAFKDDRRVAEARFVRKCEARRHANRHYERGV